MEYSVYDLIRILLKKWYIILLTMALVSGLSTVTARKSYEKAVADYEQYTSETISAGVETGSLIALYQYSYEVNDLSRYTAPYETKAAFLEKFADSFQSAAYGQDEKISVYDLGEQAFSKVSEDFSRLLTDSLVMDRTQDAMTPFQYQEPPTIDANGTILPSAGPLNIYNHLTVDILDAATLRIIVSGLEESVSTQIVAAYLENLQTVGPRDYALDITTEESSVTFYPDAVQFTAAAQFAQTVMQKPAQAPIFVKTVGTAAAYAFVLVCFLILLVTFIKDTHPSKKKNLPKAA